MEIIEPPKLKRGDTIAFVSPSGGLSALVPHRLENAKKYLESQGYTVEEFPLTKKRIEWESAPAEERANELMNAFKDKNINAIICTIGGHNSNKILKYLNFEDIRNNPKIFCGFSDITILLNSITVKSKLITYYGPAALPQFGEHPMPLDYTIEHFNKAVVKQNIGIVKPSKNWTDETLDWLQKKDLERPRKLNKNNGYEWLRDGSGEGEIYGGCLHTLIHLIVSKHCPDFTNKILFIEVPEGDNFTKGESLAEVDAQLGDLENNGIFEKIKGLIVGRPFGYTPNEWDKFKKIIIENTQDHNFPILFGADIGHTDPQITIPIGKKVLIDSEKNIFEFIEN